MIQIALHDNNFVKVTLTNQNRIDLATLKRVTKDVIRICDGEILPVNVHVSKEIIIPVQSKRYFTKLVSLKDTNNISFNWYHPSFIKYTDEEATKISKEVQEYFSFKILTELEL